MTSVGPSVAVVIPSFNHGRYIAQTLASVFKQTHLPNKILVIDDGSTDDSVQVIKDAFVIAPKGVNCVLETQSNLGISATRNALISEVDTDYVAFLDSDDLYHPNRLEHLLARAPVGGGFFFAVSGVNFLSSSEDEGRYWNNAYQAIMAQASNFPTAGFALLRSNFMISASNFLISQELLTAVGKFDERLLICQDWDFALRALQYVEPVFVPKSLLTYRRHLLNTSQISGRQSDLELKLVYDKFSEWMGRNNLNPYSPTPIHWPKFFRVFASVCKAMRKESVASLLPKDIFLHSLMVHYPTYSLEREAILRLIKHSLILEEIDNNVSILEIMQACADQWGSYQ